MNLYKIILKHDNSKITITTTASNEEQAVKTICKSEKCPERAILKIKMVKVIY